VSRPELRHDVRVVDTTLRDGSHAMAHQFTESQVRDTVRALDRAGVEVIEVTHGDGLGGSSFNYGFSRTDGMTLIAAAREEARQAKIAVLLVPGIGTVEDLKQARDAGADMVRVATHCTEADVSPQHFGAPRDLGMETAGFLMMAHRTSPEHLAEQARIMVDAGCQAPYVTDSAGALLMPEARARFAALAARLAGAVAERTAIAQLSDEHPGLDLATAYRVQRELRAPAGPLAGWKLGVTSRAEQAQVCVSEPVHGFLATARRASTCAWSGWCWRGTGRSRWPGSPARSAPGARGCAPVRSCSRAG
jgi:hypothetical protein